MRYISTRGGAPAVDFAETLLAGLAPDGGLYVPETWPQLSPDDVQALSGQPYAEVAGRVLSLFAGDSLSAAEARDIARAAYGAFSHAAVTPLVQLDSDLWLLELFHGPTLAFKDVAMQMLRRLYDRALQARGERLTIVCATSGDTGGAAVEAFRGSPHIDLAVLFPEGRISEVQRRFMTAVPDANVRCVSVEGTFDDCQAIVKALFADRAFADDVRLSGVNSINWARILAQSVYYATSSLALGGGAGRLIDYRVPTGNFGDAFAGHVARKIGFPVGRITIATNENDILARALNTGRYERGAVVATQSPAMDIQIASNFERLYFEAVGRDASETRAAFETVGKGGTLTIPSQALSFMRDGFAGEATSEEATANAVRRAWDAYGEIIDPHTAVALSGAMAEARRGPTVVLSTAHPAKFPEAVSAACGQTPTLPARAGDLYARPERISRLPADVEAVKAFVRSSH